MSLCPTFTFQLSIMSKWLAKHIGTRVSFIFTTRKRHVNIDICWHWIWNQYFYFGIWNKYRTKIIVPPSFQLVTRINLQNRNETVFIKVLWHIIFYMNIGISNRHNWSFEPTNMMFLFYFSSLHDFRPPSTWKSLVHNSWFEMERCEKRAFQPSKCEKRKSDET